MQSTYARKVWVTYGIFINAVKHIKTAFQVKKIYTVVGEG